MWTARSQNETARAKFFEIDELFTDWNFVSNFRKLLSL